MSRSSPPFALRLVFIVALMFTLVGVIETMFVVYDVATGGRLSYRRMPDQGIGIRSWTEHHALRPGFSEPNFHTNSFGLRSPEVAVPKPAGVFRVLLLGDSFTFGYGAREDDVFARQLERLLRERHPGRSIEVVNAGVISYCPLLEYLQYRNHLTGLDADVVILNFDMSDVQDHGIYARSAGFAADGTALWASEPSLGQRPGSLPSLLSFEFVARAIKVAMRRTSTVEGSSDRDTDRYIWALDNGPDMAPEAAAAMAPIASLATLLEHQQVPFLLATYPQPWQVSAEATSLPPIRTQYGIGMNTVHLNDRAFQKLEGFATAHGIRFMNATNTFRAAPDAAKLYLDDDFHWTPRGNRLYATELANALDGQAGLQASGSGPRTSGSGLQEARQP